MTSHLPIGRAVPLQRIKGRDRSTRKVLRAQRRFGAASPHELVIRGRDRTVMFACRTCGTCYSTSTMIGPEADRIAYARDQAVRCCNARCRACATAVARHTTECRSCTDTRFSRERRAAGWRMHPVEYDGGWIYSTHVSGSGNGYFDSLESLVQHVEECCDEGLTMPPWVHPCDEIHPSLNLDWALETMDEHFGVEDQYPSEDLDLAELTAAVAAVNQQALSITGYVADLSRVIILDAVAFNARHGVDDHGRPITAYRDRVPTVDPITHAQWLSRISEAQAEALGRLHEEGRIR